MCPAAGPFPGTPDRGGSGTPGLDPTAAAAATPPPSPPFSLSSSAGARPCPRAAAAAVAAKPMPPAMAAADGGRAAPATARARGAVAAAGTSDASDASMSTADTPCRFQEEALRAEGMGDTRALKLSSSPPLPPPRAVRAEEAGRPALRLGPLATEAGGAALATAAMVGADAACAGTTGLFGSLLVRWRGCCRCRLCFDGDGDGEGEGTADADADADGSAVNVAFEVWPPSSGLDTGEGARRSAPGTNFSYRSL